MNTGPIATKPRNKGAKLASVAATPAAAIEVEVDQGTATRTVTPQTDAADTATEDPTNEMGNEAADSLVALQAEWGTKVTAESAAPSIATTAGNATTDAAATGDQMEEDDYVPTLTADSAEGTVVQFSSLFKTALHIVLATSEKSIVQQERTVIGPLDAPLSFAPKGKGHGLLQAAMKAYSENFQSAFNRDVLVVGTQQDLTAVGKRVALAAAQRMGEAIVADIGQHLTADNLIEVLGADAVSEGQELSVEAIIEYLDKAVGYSTTFVEATNLIDEATEETIFTITVRLNLASLIDVKDVFAKHEEIAQALVDAVTAYELEDVQQTWLVSDVSLRHPNNRALLGKLLDTDYYTTTTAGEVYASRGDANAPLADMWKFFPLDSDDAVVRHCSGHPQTGALDGTWIATCAYT